MRGAKKFEDLRAWQAARAFKMGVYELTEAGPLSRDLRLRDQLREAAASAASHLSEGFGRFDPVDCARFARRAKGSLAECRNHLQDAVDRNHISEDARLEHTARIQEALLEIGGLIDYLQSPEAKRNAERVRQARFERRRRRLNPEPEL